MSRFVIVLLLLFWPSALFGGLRGAISLSSGYESNLFHASDAEPDLVSQAGVRLGYEWKQDFLTESLALEGSGLLFSAHPLRAYSLQSAHGAVGWLPSKKSLVRLGASVARRVDRADYSMYDYREIGGFIDGKLWLGDRSNVLAGYAFAQRRYAVLDAFDYDEQRVRAQADLPLGDRTSVVLLNELGFKQYHSPMKGSGKGRHLHQENALAIQWRGSVRLSRPLGENTGLRFSLRRSINLGDCISYNALQATDFLAGEELYDDPYAYESQEYDLLVSRRLQPGLIVRAGCGVAFKDYRQKVASETGNHAPGAGLRSDRLSRINLRLEKVWKQRSDPLTVKLFAESLYLRNDSNDPLYRYTAFCCTAGVGVEF